MPQERKTEGLLLDKSIRIDITLSILRRLSGIAGLIDRGREQTLVAGAIERFHIERGSAQDRVRTLSGGNQQKVLLEKWLQTRPSVLLLNDVTRGVDIRTSFRSMARSPPRRRRESPLFSTPPTRSNSWG